MGPFDQGGVWPCTYQAALTKPPLLMQRVRRVQKLLEDRAGCLISVSGDKERWQRKQSKALLWGTPGLSEPGIIARVCVGLLSAEWCL